MIDLARVANCLILTQSPGRIELCDRYVALSYVLQRMDGVSIEFIESLNSAAPAPDLAVFLVADPHVAARRIARRGVHTRFESGLVTSKTEIDLYRDTCATANRPLGNHTVGTRYNLYPHG